MSDDVNAMIIVAVVVAFATLVVIPLVIAKSYKLVRPGQALVIATPQGQRVRMQSCIVSPHARPGPSSPRKSSSERWPKPRPPAASGYRVHSQQTPRATPG